MAFVPQTSFDQRQGIGEIRRLCGGPSGGARGHGIDRPPWLSQHGDQRIQAQQRQWGAGQGVVGLWPLGFNPHVRARRCQGQLRHRHLYENR